MYAYQGKRRGDRKRAGAGGGGGKGSGLRMKHAGTYGHTAVCVRKCETRPRVGLSNSRISAWICLEKINGRGNTAEGFPDNALSATQQQTVRSVLKQASPPLGVVENVVMT